MYLYAVKIFSIWPRSSKTATESTNSYIAIINSEPILLLNLNHINRLKYFSDYQVLLWMVENGVSCLVLMQLFLICFYVCSFSINFMRLMHVSVFIFHTQEQYFKWDLTSELFNICKHFVSGVYLVDLIIENDSKKTSSGRLNPFSKNTFW